MEADLVTRAGIPFKAIPAAGVHGVGLKAIWGVWQLTRGYFAARKLIREFKPDVLFFTGGYVAVPTGLAGRKIPTLLYVPDIEPALALRTLVRFADKVAVTTDNSRQYLPEDKSVSVTGYPVRQEMKVWPKDEAVAAFTLTRHKPILLVTGGSLGAQSINRAVIKALPQLLEDIQIIHLTGRQTWSEVEAAAKELPEHLAQNYRPCPYLYEEMAAAFSAADLIVSRAGASVLGELPQFSIPAILVPYPYAWRYQIINAEYLTEKGAAVVVRDENLQEELLPLVTSLLLENNAEYASMKAAMKSLATPGAAREIGKLLMELAAEKMQPQGGVR